jgi:glycosyltransferase involved in cell wall biosynthesis
MAHPRLHKKERWCEALLKEVRIPPASSDYEKGCIFVSTYLPRECGIATFTKDLIEALDRLNQYRLRVVAVNEPATIYTYDERVKRQIQQDVFEDYIQVADYINSSRFGVVNLQHEFGIFGGESGEYIISLLENVQKPLVTTLHTVAPDLPPKAQEVLRSIVSLSSSIVVMVRAAKHILEEYDIVPKSVRVIQHGCPDVPFVESASVKNSLGLKDRTVLSTFGLISRGKGIEYAIRALARVVDRYPKLLYLVIGETHPSVRKTEGERYRTGLMKLVDKLGLREHVRFHNRFLSKRELIRFLQATDIYVTPYISPNQISSGTLVYALGTGKAIISTPFLHAKEVLANGRGLFCEFNDPNSIAECMEKLLESEALRKSLQKKAYAYSRGFVWSNVARDYAEAFEQVSDKVGGPS